MRHFLEWHFVQIVYHYCLANKAVAPNIRVVGAAWPLCRNIYYSKVGVANLQLLCFNNVKQLFSPNYNLTVQTVVPLTINVHVFVVSGLDNGHICTNHNSYNIHQSMYSIHVYAALSYILVFNFLSLAFIMWKVYTLD